MIELKGIEVNHQGTDRIIKIIVRDDTSVRFKVHKLKTGVPVNKGTIRALSAGAFGHKPAELIWPRHIEVPEK